MSRHDFNRVTDTVMKTAKYLYDNEKFFVGQLAIRANQVAQAYPYDSTSVSFSNFLKKRAEATDVVFITRAELKDVYNKLYHPNNKIAHHFKQELGIVEEPKRNVMLRDPKEGENLVTEAYTKCADQAFAEQLTDVFEGRAPKPYSSTMAKDAQKACARELNLCGLLPRSIDVVTGQENILICKATYDTPKGHCHTLIPVEIINNKPLIPSVFLTISGFVDLNAKHIKEHIKKTAGKSYHVDIKQLLGALTNTAKFQPMSDVERIVMKTAALKETPSSYDLNGIIYKEASVIDPPSPNLEIPKLPDTDKFSAKLSSNIGTAEFIFGRDIVNRGRGLIEQELKSAGHKNSQIAVSDITKSSIIYAVSANGFGFTVPMKVVNGSMDIPKVIVASGRVFEFSADGINNMLSTADTNPTASAQASPLNALKPSSLVEEVRQALKDNNYLKAEEALHVLKASGDDIAYKAGYSVFINSLSKKEGCVQSTCSAPVKSSSSKYTLCSHTGLPLHKVYQDDQGNCLPLYRKQMKESSEGASFLHNRVYFE